MRFTQPGIKQLILLDVPHSAQKKESSTQFGHETNSLIKYGLVNLERGIDQLHGSGIS